MGIFTTVGATKETIKNEDPRWFIWCDARVNWNELTAENIMRLAQAGRGLITINELVTYLGDKIK